MRFGSAMVIGQPRLMHHSMPGDTRSFTLSTFAALILSPGTTSALTGPALSASTVAAASHQPGLLAIVLSSFAMLGGRATYQCAPYLGVGSPVNMLGRQPPTGAPCSVVGVSFAWSA